MGKEQKIIPEEQAGFCERKGCTDNAFLLQLISQLRLRFPDTAVYVLFIDFQRIFDSVPHGKLWAKLLKVGVSTKYIRILKNFYEQAVILIKKDSLYSEPIKITEGVLQERGLDGLSLGDLREILMLLYADDIALLARSALDLKKRLRILEKYCAANGLTVNVSKTKVLVCRTSGRSKKCDRGFKYCGTDLEIVKSYVYLEVPFSSNLRGELAASEFAKKGRQAAGTVLSILAKLKASSWSSKTKFYNSICKSTFLYLAHIWGLKAECYEKLEAAHLYFFKRLFRLPSCTPHCALRLELNLDHICLDILNLAYNWVIKILEMPSTRLPKACFLRLRDLDPKVENLN
ncbi:uncharacterized protein LOC130665905 [Microplitis mediator]|uniref:uncharacterized protein LOC130665905 n=1 Tax=Microplitis mediator TaxID=375433 RepID=UPI0025539D81|nr:uncharacterized protein LOC130665905 [Microplitis mediator]